MRWNGQEVDAADARALPGLETFGALVRTVQTPDFAGITFHEVLAKSALNRVPGAVADSLFGWTINPYRGCSHACTFCFARNTHTYLDLDAGHDFDSRIVVKVNVAEVLRRELGRATWTRELVALGTNTDPYQRAEGRYRLMPEIIDALADSGTPFSILTKGTLLRRDIPALVRAAERVGVEVAMTVDVFDPDLQASLEPGAPSSAARLETVRAVRAAGLPCAVFVMPVLPYLTDSVEHLERAFAAIAESGADSAAYSALHLKRGAREWFLAWLERERPDLIAPYRRLYGSGVYAPPSYREWLAGRVRPILRRYGLDRPPRRRPVASEIPPALAADLTPTLF